MFLLYDVEMSRGGGKFINVKHQIIKIGSQINNVKGCAKLSFSSLANIFLATSTRDLFEFSQ